MEVEDWDMSTRLLYGLQHSPPSDHGMAEQYPDSKIQHELKAIAVRLYNHQKMTPMFASKVTDGRNTLAYLLCASYESSPSSSPESNGRLRLRNCTPLPLAQWDRLYYVVCAEIRSMYSALEEAFGKDFEGGATILHNAGPEGISGSPRHLISGLRLARILEDTWIAVTDERLRGPLNAALAGRLINTDGMDPEEITEMVFNDLPKATTRRSDDETLLARARAEVRELSHSPPRRKNSKHSPSTQCRCSSGCRCRKVCGLQPNECECTHMRGQICEMMEKQHDVHNAVQEVLTRALTGNVQTHNHILGAATNNIAQMQVTDTAHSEPHAVQTSMTAYQASEKAEAGILQKQRKRANTNNSELAYVPPPRTPTRGKKDAYPLGFYGDYSGHRYPTFRATPDSAPPPVYGSSYSSQIPARKPVPRAASKAEEQILGCDSTEINRSVAESESKGLYTQSFPVPAHWNPRQPIFGAAHEDAQSYADLAEEAHNAIRPFSDEPDFYLPAHEPFRPALHTTPTAPVTIPNTTKSNQEANGSPSSATSSLNKPCPPLPPTTLLPEPDFIRPRPALKQRYVSAGGNTKLSDREEISGPAMSATISSRNSGVRPIPKDQLFEMLNDPDFVRANFGEEAAGKMPVATPPVSARPSVDNSPSKHGGGVRSSATAIGTASWDSKVEGFGYQIKRERTESGGSFTGRLRRAFSRKNSQVE
ncbi:hypothetical protein LTR78_004880 [Recurvomyces mirabilis]|uniref:Uncharacterized protein n=1 Tax=Recurvomyces mirabilis TaxID=574656 RepID=A0AAE0WPH3_9PEZI|nr:hypothetical protein LTR78_004880 [Recurvomyces mirabilis]KAK5158050.1 hypothetical protein LTS14_003973 [Recurvomyces mirabilis]